MTEFNLSASAPDILGENESMKIIGKRKNSVRITLTPTKKSDIASIAEAEDFMLSDDYDQEEGNNENRSFMNLESIKTLVNYSNDTSYLSQNEKNSRYHTLRSELNSFRKARRRAIMPNGDCNVIQKKHLGTKKTLHARLIHYIGGRAMAMDHFCLCNEFFSKLDGIRCALVVNRLQPWRSIARKLSQCELDTLYS